MRNSASKRQHPIDVIDANGVFPFWEITRINIRHNALLSIAVSVVLLLNGKSGQERIRRTAGNVRFPDWDHNADPSVWAGTEP